MPDRAVAPIVAVVCLVGVVVALAAAVGGAVPTDVAAPPPSATIGASAGADGELRLTHRGGEPLTPETLRLRVSVDGERLDKQPPVPFFSAHGFESGPDGPFNSAWNGDWRAGETATVTVAETNAPSVTVGSTVEIRLYAGDHRLARLETTASTV